MELIGSLQRHIGQQWHEEREEGKCCRASYYGSYIIVEASFHEVFNWLDVSLGLSYPIPFSILLFTALLHRIYSYSRSCLVQNGMAESEAMGRKRCLTNVLVFVKSIKCPEDACSGSELIKGKLNSQCFCVSSVHLVNYYLIASVNALCRGFQFQPANK